MNKYKKAYILGIGGTGMSSIAKYLSQSGLSVIGYDQRRSYITNALEQDEISIDFQVEDIVYKKDTLYIFSTAFDISKTNNKFSLFVSVKKFLLPKSFRKL